MTTPGVRTTRRVQAAVVAAGIAGALGVAGAVGLATASGAAGGTENSDQTRSQQGDGRAWRPLRSRDDDGDGGYARPQGQQNQSNQSNQSNQGQTQVLPPQPGLGAGGGQPHGTTSGS